MLEKYKKFYELYGSGYTAMYANVSKQYMCRYAKANNWKTPTAEQANKNVVKKLTGLI